MLLFPSLIACLVFLISEVSTTTSTSIASERFNPRDSKSVLKGENVPEGGFFDASSKDLENSFFTFLLNNHPSYRTPDFPYALSSSHLAVANKELLDLEMLDSCVLINSHWFSSGLNEDEIKPLLEAFWQGIGMFEYIKFDQSIDDWVEVNDKSVLNTLSEGIESLAIEDNAATSITVTKKNKNKKGKKTTNSKNSKNSNTVTMNNKNKNIIIKSALMHPKMEKMRLTLESPICLRAMSVAISVLNPKQCAELFRNAPIELLEDPELLKYLPDYSEFVDELSVGKLVAIFAASKWQLIPEWMAKTLPIGALHKVLEARNFDISTAELHLLMINRFGFELQEPFVSDHRTFRLFTAENPRLPIPAVDQFLNRAIDGALIESILAHYVLTEHLIHVTFSLIVQIWFECKTKGQYSREAFLEKAAGLIAVLKYNFGERKRLISALQGNEKLVKLLGLPINGNIRDSLRESEHNSPEINTQSTTADVWRGALLELYNVSDISSIAPYSFATAEEAFELWQAICADLSEEFSNGRWTRNFLQLLLSSLTHEPCVEFKQKTDAIMRHYYGPMTSGNGFDWFFLAVEHVFKCSGGNEQVDLRTEFRVTRELKKIFKSIAFIDEAIEAIWKNPWAMTAVVNFPDCLDQDQIDALVGSELGNELLRANPGLLQRLPCYSNFTLADMNRLKLRLDDVAQAIGTVHVQTAREWLQQEEFLVNSSVRGLLFPHMTVHDSDSWSLVNFEGFSAAYERMEELDAVRFLEISSKMTDGDLPQILSLVARWMVHMEMQNTWMWLFSRIPSLGQMKRELLIFTTVEVSESKKIFRQLKKEFERTGEMSEKRKIRELMIILKERFISSFKLSLNKSDSAREQMIKDNEFISDLIANGPGSERFKRVWCHRAKLLIYSDLSTEEQESLSNLDQGLFPLDDAVLQWFWTNKMNLETLRIKASVNRQLGVPVQKVGDEESEYATWYNALF